MINSKVKFLHDTYAMKIICQDLSMHKTAQGTFDGFASSVLSTFMSKFDKNNRVASILNLVAPGFLWMFGFRKFFLLYNIVEAFGFDWTKFWASLPGKLEPFLHELDGGETGSYSELSDIVQETAANSTKAPNPKKIIEHAQNSNLDLNEVSDQLNSVKANSIENVVFLTRQADGFFSRKNRSSKPGILKSLYEEIMNERSGRVTGIRSGISGFFLRIITWVLAIIIIGAGCKLVGAAAAEAGKRLLGKEVGEDDETNSKNDGQNLEQETNEPNEKSPSKQPLSKQPESKVLKLNTNAPEHLFTTVYNDDTHMWILHMSINDLKQNLINWTKQLYPELNDVNAFTSSQDFNKLVGIFEKRNPNVTMSLIAVPERYKSIKMIVDQFANDVANHTSSLHQNIPTANSTSL